MDTAAGKGSTASLGTAAAHAKRGPKNGRNVSSAPHAKTQRPKTATKSGMWVMFEESATSAQSASHRTRCSLMPTVKRA